MTRSRQPRPSSNRPDKEKSPNFDGRHNQNRAIIFDQQFVRDLHVLMKIELPAIRAPGDELSAAQWGSMQPARSFASPRPLRTQNPAARSLWRNSLPSFFFPFRHRLGGTDRRAIAELLRPNSASLHYGVLGRQTPQWNVDRRANALSNVSEGTKRNRVRQPPLKRRTMSRAANEFSTNLVSPRPPHAARPMRAIDACSPHEEAPPSLRARGKCDRRGAGVCRKNRFHAFPFVIAKTSCLGTSCLGDRRNSGLAAVQ
jgi:hypothetical protein